MTLKQLKAFYWAARLGSFAIAADRLSISQSSLSKRIVELETGLGKALFDRSSRRASLTAEGELALEDVKRMLDMETELRRKLDGSNELQGLVRIGIGELTATTWFPRFMRRLSEDHPQLRVEPMISQARLMEGHVERGTLDCAVIAGRTVRPALASDPLATVEFAWMASPGLGLRGRKLTREALQQHAVIAPASPTGQAQSFDDWLTTSGMEVAKPIHCNSVHAAVEMAVAGLGIAILPRALLRPVLKRRLLAMLHSTPSFPPLPYSFIWRRDDNRSMVAQVRQLALRNVDYTLSTPLWEFEGG